MHVAIFLLPRCVEDYPQQKPVAFCLQRLHLEYSSQDILIDVDSLDSQILYCMQGVQKNISHPKGSDSSFVLRESTESIQRYRM